MHNEKGRRYGLYDKIRAHSTISRCNVPILDSNLYYNYTVSMFFHSFSCPSARRLTTKPRSHCRTHEVRPAANANRPDDGHISQEFIQTTKIPPASTESHVASLQTIESLSQFELITLTPVPKQTSSFGQYHAPPRVLKPR